MNGTATVTKIISKIAYFFYTIWAALVFTSLLLLVIPILALSVILGHPKRDHVIFWTLKAYAESFCVLCFIRKKIYFHPAYSDASRVLLPNHASYFDPIALYLSTDRTFRTLGKKEVSKIPIFGYLYRLAVILVDRGSSTSRAHAYRAMKKGLEWTDICIFPQGTFHDGELFSSKVYSGGFRLAQSQRSDMVPMLLLDTHSIFSTAPRFSIRPGPCRIIFLEPITYTDYVDISMDNIMSLYVDYMQNSLDFISKNDIRYLRDHNRQWLASNLEKYK